MLQILLAIHVLSIVIWIGGVAFVTLVVFPMITRMEGSLEQVLMFQGVEHRFARIAKLMVAISGITGLILLYYTRGFGALFSMGGIGPTIMLIVWAFYLLILLFEARLFKVIFRGGAQKDTKKVFYRLTVFHWVVLGLSLLAVGVGVWAGHGGL